MSRNLLFKISKDIDIKEFISMFRLVKVLENDRTTIYENNEMRASIDSNKVVRVLVFKESNVELVELLREHFYGNEYKEL